MQQMDFDQTLDAVLTKDPRYSRDAYHFLREALDHTRKTVVKAEKGKVRHVTGQELLGGIRSLALEKFGPMAITVLAEWGVTRCEDFGEIVFNLVDGQLLSITEQDRKADFSAVYDFQAAFVEPFLPASRRAKLVEAAKPPVP